MDRAVGDKALRSRTPPRTTLLSPFDPRSPACRHSEEGGSKHRFSSVGDLPTMLT